jgi:hypothetical protein
MNSREYNVSAAYWPFEKQQDNLNSRYAVGGHLVAKSKSSEIKLLIQIGLYTIYGILYDPQGPAVLPRGFFHAGAGRILFYRGLSAR